MLFMLVQVAYEMMRKGRNLRNASVSIRIIASKPTRKKDPTKAIYSLLNILLAMVFQILQERV